MSQPPLSPPAGRQGPGAMPAPVVELLDLVVARRAAGALPGDRRGAGVGQGTELAQLRPYVVGDDVRRLDAAASARTGVPHVRLEVPERTLTSWLVLDISPSMAFGTAERLKSDVAEGVALVLGRLAVRRGGRVALVRFGAGAPRLMPPHGGRGGVIALRRALAEGLAADGTAPDGDALGRALARTGRVATQPGLVVVVSDFRDATGWERPMGALAARHSVLAIEIHDPRESDLPAAGQLRLVDPETGAIVDVDSSRRGLRERFAEAERHRRDGVARELKRLRVPHVTLSTAGDWLADLGRTLR